ncbi:MAG: response regulator transcription factor [Deltaproteobacteria bacterium]|nr:response regulator transcription factor [Deltaproteobacteria bacterium]
MVDKKKLLIVDDHTILREGLKALLLTSTDLEIVGEADDGRKAVHLAETLSPDLILMDLSMPRMDGMEAVREIKKKWPDIKVLALTVHKTEEYVLMTLQAGVDGYLLKDATHQEMMTAVRSVLVGKRYLSPGISEKVIEGYLNGKQTVKTRSSWDSLTSREREVLKLIGEGYKNKGIADQLNISPKTVEKHRANLMEKLNLHNTSELTAYAIEKGLVVK